MSEAALLAALMRDPARAAGLGDGDWTGLLAVATAEQMLGTVAERLIDQPAPPVVARLLADARISAAAQRTHALWEVEMARRALAGVCPLILLKGSAYAAAGLSAGVGRSIGDLDILVPRDRLDAAEAALLAAGWEWVKPDPYDDAYYRRWMHELPPMIHRARDRMIDVHHTILPLTARITPDAAAMVAASVPIAWAWGRGDDAPRVLAPADMLLHNVAHLFADGDLSGGLRNLWDFDRLVRALAADAGFAADLAARARLHGLDAHLARAMRLSGRLYGTPVIEALAGRTRIDDDAFVRRMTARDGWGRGTDRPLRLAFYIRSHWLRMPPAMLARHLWTKWRKGAPVARTG